jgi:hypothetical protein
VAASLVVFPFFTCEELERLNEECTSEHETSLSRECQLDAVAARNILKVALATQVMHEISRQHDHDEENPYALLQQMDDASADHMQRIPTASVKSARKLDRIVQCAEDGNECDLMEITDLIDELERLNLECEGTISRQCSLDAVAARNVLKVALAHQAAVMAQNVRK